MGMAKYEFLRAVEPLLQVQLSLYSTEQGGKTKPISVGFACPCFPEKDQTLLAHTGYPLLDDHTMHPGESRNVGYWFMLGEEAATRFRSSGRFFLWEGRFVGEAIVL